MKRESRAVWSWALFDFANSSYSLIMLSFVFPIFFKEFIAGPARGDFWWGVITSTSVLIGGLAAPFIGALADVSHHRRHKFILFSAVAMLATALLFFSTPGAVLYASILFILANASFEVAIVLYDAYLPHISTPKTSARISGLGWGLGYLGGIIAMLAFIPLYKDGFEASPIRFKLTFVATALFFFVFAIPAFRYLPNVPGKIRSLKKASREALKQVWQTIRSAREYKSIGVFLAAFYFLNDGLVTVFAFVPIYASTTFNFSLLEVGGLVLFAQLVAAPSTMILGRLADKVGKKRMQLFTVAGWIVVLIVLASTQSVVALFIATGLAGIVMGSSQAVARAWLASLIPKGKEAQFYGFNGFASKIAATSGPLVFGTVSVLTGNQRVAMLALLPFFVLSFALFLFVPSNK